MMSRKSTGVRAFVACAAVFGSAALAPAAAEQRHDGRDGSALCSARGSVSGLEVDCPAATVATLLAALRAATGLQSEYPIELGSARVSVLRRSAPLYDVLEGALAGFNFAISMDEEAPHQARVHIVDVRGGTSGATQTAPSPGGQIEPLPNAISRAATSDASPTSVPSGGRRRSDARAAGPHPAGDEFEQQRVREQMEDSRVEGTPHPEPASEPGSVMTPLEVSQPGEMPMQSPR
jgi:hypothetical protein